ncbi:DUF551 domain-containing protein [Pseudomonas putida]|uniref:DUF551 domain-containing protein n=1 Tax=Pseudomonas putida TaxID=303 RepID=UPI00235CCA4C|nr:DUF551 domain-containing protein [Pseudomonas putida]GLO44202.1 hypothetical protein PPUN109347_07640 [Pseudomonas putida]HDS0979503.1 DUF551 domain-containing protein [Pseudomonas putida]
MSGWIKCSDRLPPNEKAYYLIVCESGEIALTDYIYDSDVGWCFWYDPEATHWMPLPAPPTE